MNQTALFVISAIGRALLPVEVDLPYSLRENRNIEPFREGAEELFNLLEVCPGQSPHWVWSDEKIGSLAPAEIVRPEEQVVDEDQRG